MTNDLIEKLKNAKTRDEVDALIKTTMDGKVALSIDDLGSVTGGQYDPVNNPLPEELKPMLIEMVKRGWTDVAADILLGTESILNITSSMRWGSLEAIWPL